MKTASAYPIFVLSLGLVSAVLVIVWILPKVLGLISGGIPILPWPTRLLMWLSDFLKLYGWLVVVLIIAGGY